MQIYTEDVPEEFAGILSEICGYEVELRKEQEFPSESNSARFCLIGVEDSLSMLGVDYPDWVVRSRFSMHVYGRDSIEPDKMGEDLKDKVDNLWSELSRPVGYASSSLGVQAYNADDLKMGE